MALPRLEIPSMRNLRRLSAEVPVILGSGSPRRKDLLQRARIPFTIVIAEAPEIALDDETPQVATKRLATLKARCVAERVARERPGDSAVIIAADTIVWSRGDCLGKPADEAEAREFLLRLRGKTHQVFTAVSMALRIPRMETVIEAEVAQTAVTFKDVSDKEIESYLATGDSLDKAGAYGAQEPGAFLVDHLAGALDTVIGFPLSVVEELAGIFLGRVQATDSKPNN